MQNAREPGSIRSVALPGLGANTGRVPVEICADLMWTGYNLFRRRAFDDFAAMRAALEEELGDLGPTASSGKPKAKPPLRAAPSPAPPPRPTPSAKDADIDFDDSSRPRCRMSISTTSEANADRRSRRRDDPRPGAALQPERARPRGGRVGRARRAGAGTFLIRLRAGPGREARQGDRLRAVSRRRSWPARFAEVVAALRAEGFGPPGLGAMLEALASPDPAVRARAAIRLGWRRSVEAVGPLLDALPGAVDDACALLDALGAIGDPRAIPAVRDYADAQAPLAPPLGRRGPAEPGRRRGARRGDRPGARAAPRPGPGGLRRDRPAGRGRRGDRGAGRRPSGRSTASIRGWRSTRSTRSARRPRSARSARCSADRVRSALSLALRQEHLQAIAAPPRPRHLRLAEPRHRGPGAQDRGDEGRRSSRATTASSATTPIFRRKTQDYLRRLGWRYLRNLAAYRPELYAHAAAEVLVAYTPEDAEEPEGLRGEFARCYLLHRILWGASERFRLDDRRLTFRFRDADSTQPPAGVREEAFPDLWDAEPTAYLPRPRGRAAARGPRLRRAGRRGAASAGARRGERRGRPPPPAGPLRADGRARPGRAGSPLRSRPARPGPARPAPLGRSAAGEGAGPALAPACRAALDPGPGMGPRLPRLPRRRDGLARGGAGRGSALRSDAGDASGAGGPAARPAPAARRRAPARTTSTRGSPARPWPRRWGRCSSVADLVAMVTGGLAAGAGAGRRPARAPPGGGRPPRPGGARRAGRARGRGRPRGGPRPDAPAVGPSSAPIPPRCSCWSRANGPTPAPWPSTCSATPSAWRRSGPTG